MDKSNTIWIFVLMLILIGIGVEYVLPLLGIVIMLVALIFTFWAILSAMDEIEMEMRRLFNEDEKKIK